MDSLLLCYSVLYAANSLYCAYESVFLLSGPCMRADFSSGYSQRGFFFILCLAANASRFTWLVVYATNAIPLEDADSLTRFLRSVPELLFIVSYSFLGAYFAQVPASFLLLSSLHVL